MGGEGHDKRNCQSPVSLVSLPVALVALAASVTSVSSVTPVASFASKPVPVLHEHTTKRRRQCAECKDPTHDRRTCPQLKVIKYANRAVLNEREKVIEDANGAVLSEMEKVIEDANGAELSETEEDESEFIQITSDEDEMDDDTVEENWGLKEAIAPLLLPTANLNDQTMASYLRTYATSLESVIIHPQIRGSFPSITSKKRSTFLTSLSKQSGIDKVIFINNPGMESRHWDVYVWAVEDAEVYLVDSLAPAKHRDDDMTYMEKLLVLAWPNVPWSSFRRVCVRCVQQVDGYSCRLFASYFAREAGQGRKIGGSAPNADVLRTEMKHRLHALDNGGELAPGIGSVADDEEDVWGVDVLDLHSRHPMLNDGDISEDETDPEVLRKFDEWHKSLSATGQKNVPLSFVRKHYLDPKVMRKLIKCEKYCRTKSRNQ